MGLVAGFILGTMAIQAWIDDRGAERDARERVGVALAQGSVPLNLFFAETTIRLQTLEVAGLESPGYTSRIDPGYRRYETNGAPSDGGAPIPAIADAAALASSTGVPALSMPFERAGLWYAALIKERRGADRVLEGYEGIQFPLSRVLEWWSRMRLPPGSSITLLTADGRIWLRDPFIPGLIGEAAAQDPFASGVAKDRSRLSRIIARDADGIDAVVGWRSLESFGLVLVIGIDRDQVGPAADWGATIASLLALGMTGLLLLMVTVMGRSATQGVPAPSRRPVSQAPPPVPRREPPPPQPAAPSGSLQAFARKMPVVVYQQRVGPDLSVAYKYVSPGIREIYGIAPSQLESRPELIFEMVHDDDRAGVERAFEAAWRSSEDLDIEYRIVMPTGRTKWVHNVARAATRVAGGEIGVWDGIVLDVTAQKRAESELRAARDEAELTSKVKADFLANVSHELRTPLNAIIGFSEVISNQTFGPVGIDKYLEYAHDIHESADHLLAVVNDILDLSKIEAGRATLVLEDVDASDLVDSCLRLIHGRAAEARLQLRRQVDATLPKLRVDPLKIKQILINLLSNAIKFTRSGGTVTIRVAPIPEGGVLFAVSDTGIGIAQQDMAKAIETYGRIERDASQRVEGTGLGLPLAKALAELHGGELVIDSRAGKGTTVEVRLPASCVASAKQRDS
ncbi:MAG: PAS domain-containing protein [Rhodospirillales bacterium]|nr:MAG: PAS domain-containing protein [Rhodospirillales bacterium]